MNELANFDGPKDFEMAGDQSNVGFGGINKISSFIIMFLGIRIQELPTR